MCRGYRDQTDLRFRDQSKDVSLKYAPQTVKKQYTVSQASNSLSVDVYPTYACNTESEVSRTAKDQDLIPRSLCTFPEDGAACFFFNNYVIEDSAIIHSLYDSLPGIYSKAPAGSALSNTVAALGMACLSNAMKIPEVMTNANSNYVAALRSINAKVRDPIEVKSDQTLMVVMLLGLYEEVGLSLVYTFCTELTHLQLNNTSQSMTASTNHINGALALLDLRGKQQLQTHFGVQLINALRTQVVSHFTPIAFRSVP